MSDEMKCRFVSPSKFVCSSCGEKAKKIFVHEVDGKETDERLCEDCHRRLYPDMVRMQ